MSLSDSEVYCSKRNRLRASSINYNLDDLFEPQFPDIETGMKLLDLFDESSSKVYTTPSTSTCDEEPLPALSPGDNSTRRGSINPEYPPGVYSFDKIYYFGQLKAVQKLTEADLVPRGCLFIAGYPILPNEEDLLEILWMQFSRWGEVDNIKLTSTSTGIPYGFVYFKDYKASENFMENSDKILIHRSLLRVEDARVNRSLYLLNCDENYMNPDYVLSEISKFGEIESLELEERTFLWGQEGIYLARFENWDDAIKAYQTLRESTNWMVEWGARVGQSGTIGDYSLVYVDGLNSNTSSKSHVMDLFQSIGAVKSANYINRGPASFAFVEFLNPMSSFRAVKCYNDTWWQGQNIHVHHYRRPPPSAFV